MLEQASVKRFNGSVITLDKIILELISRKAGYRQTHQAFAVDVIFIEVVVDPTPTFFEFVL